MVPKPASNRNCALHRTALPHVAFSLQVQEISAMFSWKPTSTHPRLRQPQGAAMPAPKNQLKAALAAKQPQFGIWLNLASPY